MNRRSFLKRASGLVVAAAASTLIDPEKLAWLERPEPKVMVPGWSATQYQSVESPIWEAAWQEHAIFNLQNAHRVGPKEVFLLTARQNAYLDQALVVNGYEPTEWRERILRNREEHRNELWGIPILHSEQIPPGTVHVMPITPPVHLVNGDTLELTYKMKMRAEG